MQDRLSIARYPVRPVPNSTIPYVSRLLTLVIEIMPSIHIYETKTDLFSIRIE